MVGQEIFVGGLFQFKGRQYVLSEYNNKPILLEIQTQESRISDLEKTVEQLQNQVQSMYWSNPIHDRRKNGR